ncbi:hypothetical protein [Sphingobacterium sp. DR205]|uniref:hypothetical protein n=1 Tax=Sphingobacterium sp. DR205 TaxID=2713573 RepID=UPI0013E43CFC|nr:hypothetical protein [Sphingobacterium sp. DR205]QIH34056.1 hypothetical protein G6053_14700 [Sphingobacterium sp. DR205]
MKTLSGNRFFLFNLILVFLLSCTKEGDVGPQGLEGLSGTKIYTGNTIPATTLGIAGDFYFQLTNSDFYGPKTTTGWGDPVNLRGATGAVGATGAPGTPGVPGIPGSKILNGTTAPTANLGQIGDYYLNRSNTDLYGPKTESGWGIALNLKGANGTKIYNGTAVPAAGMGINGDYYFQTTTGQLYGPKTDAGWGTPISLIGAKGADGTDGTNGTNGATILAGTTVPVAAIGKLGDFYFRSNTGDFYGPKTAAGWGNATSLKGTNGLNGAPGSQILSGINVPDIALGRIGDFYFRTNTSDFYGPKTATTWGTPVNLKGATGTAGTNGTNGAAGSKIHNGYGTPQDTLGRVGDYYISIATGNLYGPKTTTGWGDPIMNLRGPAGPQTDVIYSEWRTLYGSYQSPSSGNISGDFFVREFYDNPKLLDEAAVLVYVREDVGTKGSFISQLNCKGRLYDWVDYSFHLDQTNALIRILISNTGFDIGRKEVEENLLFRFVIIPGNKNAQGLAKALPKDYNQLKVMYKIAD